MEIDDNPVGMPRDLILVRHGESEGNAVLDAAKRGDKSLMTDEFLARSAADYRLSPGGRVQADRAGGWIRDWMAEEGFDAFDRLYCSPFARACETAATLALHRAEWQLEPLLRERDWGLWEGLDKTATAERFPISTGQKVRNKFLWRPECGENTPDVDMRAREMLGTFARELPGRRVICVTHEDVMWAFRFRLEKLTVGQWLQHEASDKAEHQIVNCAVLHYTRVAEDGTVGAKFVRVRLVDPANPNAANTWRSIMRPTFTNDDLLEQVGYIPPLWRGEDE